MKIWILSSGYFPDGSTEEAGYLRTFTRLAAAAGHDVTVVGPGGRDGLQELAPGCRLLSFRPRLEEARLVVEPGEPDAHPGWPWNNMAPDAALSHQLAGVLEQLAEREGPPEIIECPDAGAPGYAFLHRRLVGTGPLGGVPVVLHLHGPRFLFQGPAQEMRWKLPDYWTGRMEKASLCMADALLSPSRLLALEVQKQMDGPLGKCEIVPYPFGMEGLAGDPAPGEPGRLVYSGIIGLRQGLDPLLAACEALWRDGAGFSLDVIGEDAPTPLKGGSLTASVERRYAKRVGEGRLVFSGPLGERERRERLRAATAVVAPGLLEGFSHACAEAMALGKVVVAHRATGTGEMAGENGLTAYLFSHDNPGSLQGALRTVLGLSEAERRRIGGDARTRIAGLSSPERVLAARLQHFQRVIDRFSPKKRFPFVNHRLREGPEAPALPEEPLVSVVIPYYNLGDYLGECVESVRASRGVRLEIVVVNDGSTDPASLAALAALRARRLPELRVLDLPNGGLANARNVGAEAAAGELVAFVDADDCVHPDFLRRATAVLQRYPNVHLAYSWVRYFGDGRGIWHSWNFDLPYLLCHNQLIPIAVVRRATFLEHGRNKSHIEYGLEDYESWISLAEAGCGGVAIPEPLAFYRVRGDSMYTVLDADKKVYLYDLISAEHPGLMARYGLELFNLQNANGPAWSWDQPTMFRCPQDRLRLQMEHAEERLRLLEAENRQLHKDVQWHQKELRRFTESGG